MFIFYYSDGQFIEASYKSDSKLWLHSNSQWLFLTIGIGIRCERNYPDKAIGYDDSFFLPEY